MGNITILLYHQVGEEVHPNTNLDCFCEIDNFKDQMHNLYKSNIKVISLEDAILLLKNKEELKLNYVVLTFDDGCERYYTLIHPILKKYDFPSTIYPVVGFLGEQAGWCSKPNPDLRILTKHQLLDLSKEGVDIGAHSMNHYKLDLIESDECFYEIEQSKNYLEKLLNIKIKSFSYPHGRYNESILNIVKQVGFENGVTCINDFAENANSLYELPRKYVTYFDDYNSIFKKIC